MINFDFDKWCCGCTSCASSCPTGAITMQPNDEGFLMPYVDKTKCIGCGKCDRSCPHLNTSENMSGFSLKSFEGKPSYLYFSNQEERINSASGGFVYDAMRTAINNNGVICGCVWDDKMKAVHIVSDKKEDLQRMQSSKYVQSDLTGCYPEVRKALKNHCKVVFCGTPCQTAGLRHYLGKTDTENLISICLICHGVASPLVWKKWAAVIEKKYNGKLVNVNMRDKSYKGYSTSYTKYTLRSASRTQGKMTGRASRECGNLDSTYLADKIMRNVGMPTYLADPYIFLFTDDLYLRKSCNRCQYKADQNGADIIVGDFYESTPSAGNLGCSCIMAMTEKGRQFVKTLDGEIFESDYKTVGVVNPMLWTSVKEHPRRTEFFAVMKSGKLSGEKLFTSFLPMRFKIKKILNQCGVFNLYLGFKRKITRIIH